MLSERRGVGSHRGQKDERNKRGSGEDVSSRRVRPRRVVSSPVIEAQPVVVETHYDDDDSLFGEIASVVVEDPRRPTSVSGRTSGSHKRARG
jgi:hypothetical protein